MKRQFSWVWLTVIWATGVPACSTETAPRTFERERAFLAHLVESNILPSYRAASLRAGELESEVNQLCESTNAESVTRARTSWRALQDAWKRSEVFSFGPVKEYPLRLGPKIDLWPARADTIERAIRDDAWKEAGDLSVVSGWSKGLPAIEYVLYREPDPALASEALVAESDRCAYLRLLAQEARVNFELLVGAWSPDDGNFAAELTFDDPQGETRFFGTVAMAFDEVMNRTGFLIELMRQTKVAKPSGIATGNVDTSLAESRFCDCSLEDLRANLAGLRDVYGGTTVESELANEEPGSTFPSIRSLLRTDSESIDADILDAFEEVEAEILSFDDTFTKTIASDPARVDALYEKLTRLQVLFQVDLFQALGVTLTFNDNDGD